MPNSMRGWMPSIGAGAESYAICTREYSVNRVFASRQGAGSLDIGKRFVAECRSSRGEGKTHGENCSRLVGVCAARAPLVYRQVEQLSSCFRGDPLCLARGRLSGRPRYAAQFPTRSCRGSLSLKNPLASILFTAIVVLSAIARA